MDVKYLKYYRKLGLNIAYYRKDQGLTQLDLAEMLDIDRSHMGNIEQAYSGVSLDVLFRLSEVLNVPVHKFFVFPE